MKNLKELKGAKMLSKSEQRLISGGHTLPFEDDGRGGSDGSGVQMGVCLVNGHFVKTPCDSVCPDGTDPLCAY